MLHPIRFYGFERVQGPGYKDINNIKAAKEEAATFRAYMGKVQPHFHPDERVVTVLSGTLYVGFGEVFDESAMKALPTGSIWTEPPKQPHFVFAKEGEVVFQVVGANGPSGTTRIEPK